MNFDTNKPVLVIGGADHVYDDLEVVKNLIYPYSLEEFFYINVINDQIHTWISRVDILSSLHGEKVEKWLDQRPSDSNWSFVTFVHRQPDWRPEYKPLESYGVRDKWGGSSGLYAVQVSLIELGFDKIVLAGVPMSSDPNYFRDENEWRQSNKYRKGFTKAIKHDASPNIKPYVRSVSGWTKEILGAPTKEFLGVKDMEEYLEFEPVGKDELSRVFKIEGVEREDQGVELHLDGDDVAYTRVTPENNEQYLVVMDVDNVHFLDKKPTKSEVKKMVEDHNYMTEQEVEEEESAGVETEEVEEPKVEENVQPEVETEYHYEEKEAETQTDKPKKSAFDAWWESKGEKLVQQGFTRKSIGVRCARDNVQDNAIWTDVQSKIGRETVQNNSIREMCKAIAEQKSF